jgi:hypothetical protein
MGEAVNYWRDDIGIQRENRLRLSVSRCHSLEQQGSRRTLLQNKNFHQHHRRLYRLRLKIRECAEEGNHSRWIRLGGKLDELIRGRKQGFFRWTIGPSRVMFRGPEKFL